MRVLFVKLGALGDVAAATSIVPALRRFRPEVRITWLTGASTADFLRLVPGIDEIIEIDDAALLRGRPLARLVVLLALWRRLFGRRFELVATAYRDRRYRLLSSTARAELRRSFWQNGLADDRLHSDEFARLVVPEIPAGAELPRIVTSLDPVLARLLPADRKLVVLAPGGARNLLRDDPLRRWPVAEFRRSAELLLARGHAVALCGARSDAEFGAAFADLPVIDLIGRTDLANYLALLARADLLISPDSAGPHLARLVGTRVVALFGPTDPRQKIPEDARVTVLWGGADLPCRPCYDGRTYASCAENRCMRAIRAEAVVRAAERLLGVTD
jgi:heptosyltransferase-2